MNTMNYPNSSAGVAGDGSNQHEYSEQDPSESSVSASPRPETFTELKKRVQSHPVYEWRIHCLENKRDKRSGRLLAIDLSNFERRWFEELDSEQRQEVATWSQQRVRLAIADAYNGKTMEGRTFACTLMLSASLSARVKEAKAMAKRFHLRAHAQAAVQAETAARDENRAPQSPH